MAVSEGLRDEVRKRAGYRCEYCHYPEKATTSVLHLEHILPQEAQGRTALDNLALACPNCNLHKSNKRMALDPLNGEMVRLFYPRQDDWNEHFFLRPPFFEGNQVQMHLIKKVGKGGQGGPWPCERDESWE